MRRFLARAAHAHEILPVTPLQPECEERFGFDENGGIRGRDDPAKETIRLLKLDHATLVGWRRGAIAGFFPTDLVLSREEVEQLVEGLAQPTSGRLTEFSFCIRGYAMSLLA